MVRRAMAEAHRAHRQEARRGGGGGGLAGSTGERGWRAQPEGDPLRGHEDTIMGLGRVADRSGARTLRVGRRYAGRRVARRNGVCALAVVKFNYPNLKAPNS
jgi:hypothetical protein